MSTYDNGLTVIVKGGTASGKTTVAAFIGQKLQEAGFSHIEYDWQEQLVPGAIEDKLESLAARRSDDKFFQKPIRIIEEQEHRRPVHNEEKFSEYTYEPLVTPSDYAAEAVLDSLRARKGVGSELDGYDQETLGSICKDIKEIISESMGK